MQLNFGNKNSPLNVPLNFEHNVLKKACQHSINKGENTPKFRKRKIPDRVVCYRVYTLVWSCTHWFGDVHIGLELYTLVWRCTHWFGDVHIGLEMYTLVWRCTHWFGDVHIGSEMYTLVRRCTHWFGDVHIYISLIVLEAILLDKSHTLIHTYNKHCVSTEQRRYNYEYFALIKTPAKA